jgi:asparagine synthase (glutamine-hydrolysing)
MCGIAGWFQRDGRPVDAARLRAMTDRLAHRGPDDSGLWIDGPIGLGHRRLAIRDLSPQGRQPMADREGRAFITYNGELYNDADLRSRLAEERDVRFRTTCDAETIPEAYRAWGLSAFAAFEGMFAIALWDADDRTLHLVRDGIGIKPLYYAVVGTAVVFGSEPKALLASGLFGDGLDPEGLHALLATGHAGPEHSVFPGIVQVPAGSILSINADGVTCVEFWRPQRAPQTYSLDEALAALEHTLAQVVESQMVSDVPLGVLQSGGIDSTLVTLTAGRLRRDIPAFTAVFADKTYDETDLARQVAAASGLTHVAVSMESEVDTVTAFRALAYAHDGEGADTGGLAFYRLAGAVRRHATMVLSGDGGDEFFAGYDTYRATRAAAALPGRLVRPGADIAGRLFYAMAPNAEGRIPKSAVAARFLLGLGAGDGAPHLQWRRLAPKFMLPTLYGPAMRDLLAESPFARYAAAFDAAKGEVLDQALLADQRYHLSHVLAKVDRLSMAHGLEVRVPLLDRRIMDIAARLDTSLLFPAGGKPKHVLRRLADRLGAPPEVSTGAKKGFNTPIARDMRESLAPLGDWLLDANADILSPYLAPDGVRRLWRAHRTRRANHGFALWPLLVLAAFRAGEARPAELGALSKSAA